MADEDGDGIPEEVHVVGDPPEERVLKVASSSGNLLWEAGPESTGGDYLSPLVPCGDVDGDGVEDLALGEALWERGVKSPNAGVGRILALSGRTGRVLWEARGEAAWQYFGWAMALVPDCGQDGIAEIISSYIDTGHGPWVGGVAILSGASGKCLGVSIPVDDMVNGCSVSTICSDNLRRTRDIVIGTFTAPALGAGGVRLEEAGRVVVLSDLGKRQRISRSGEIGRGEFGCAVLGINDVNGDGVGDILIGACGEAQGRGCVHVVSGSDLADLAIIYGPEGGIGFGGTMWFVPNADGRGNDGVEVLYGVPEMDAQGFRVRRLRIIAIPTWEVLSDFRIERY